MKKTTLPLKHSMNRSFHQVALLLISLAVGCFALPSKARASCQQGCFINENTALGNDALLNNIGIGNTATGFAALKTNRSGPLNTAIGARALERNETGRGNTACGHKALQNTIGDDNIALGFAAGISLTTGSHNIDIGNAGVAGESGTIRIGDSTSTTTFIAGVRGVAVNGSPVLVGAGGQLGVAVSSRQFKDDIHPMEKASEAILALKPVTFRYKKEIDSTQMLSFGLIAEEVARINPDLITRDEGGKPQTVRYDAVNAMLLNEFLKEHRKVEDLQVNVAKQQRQIEALTASLQKVNAQLELNKPDPQTVQNSR